MLGWRQRLDVERRLRRRLGQLGHHGLGVSPALRVVITAIVVAVRYLTAGARHGDQASAAGQPKTWWRNASRAARLTTPNTVSA